MQEFPNEQIKICDERIKKFIRDFGLECSIERLEKEDRTAPVGLGDETLDITMRKFVLTVRRKSDPDKKLERIAWEDPRTAKDKAPKEWRTVAGAMQVILEPSDFEDFCKFSKYVPDSKEVEALFEMYLNFRKKAIEFFTKEEIAAFAEIIKLLHRLDEQLREDEEDDDEEYEQFPQSVASQLEENGLPLAYM